jgi:hypothetical protein
MKPAKVAPLHGERETMAVPIAVRPKSPKRANPYYGPLREAFREWVLLNGVLFQTVV